MFILILKNERKSFENFRTGFPGLLVQNQESVIMNGLNPPPPPQAAPPTHHTGAPHHMTNHGPITETFSVPDQLVGLIIGKNGEVVFVFEIMGLTIIS